MAIVSVGHRLTILKGVYDVKVKQGVPIDSDHWIPPCKHPIQHTRRTPADCFSRRCKRPRPNSNQRRHLTNNQIHRNPRPPHTASRSRAAKDYRGIPKTTRRTPPDFPNGERSITTSPLPPQQPQPRSSRRQRGITDDGANAAGEDGQQLIPQVFHQAAVPRFNAEEQFPDPPTPVHPRGQSNG